MFFCFILAEVGRFKQLLEQDDLRALAGVSKFPVRIKCALLGFNCLDELVDEPAAEDAARSGPGEQR